MKNRYNNAKDRAEHTVLKDDSILRDMMDFCLDRTSGNFSGPSAMGNYSNLNKSEYLLNSAMHKVGI